MATAAVLSVGVGLRPCSRWFACSRRTSLPSALKLSGELGRWIPPCRRRPAVRCESTSSSNSSFQADPGHASELIFIGTGTSEGIPRVSCLTKQPPTCKVCMDATLPGNRNRRRNTSVLFRYAHPDGRRRNILIDAGKFFYHSAMQWFPLYGIRELDAVVLTHAHADAIGGLDDLRDWTNNVQPRVPVYARMQDLEVMEKTHYYLVDTSVITAGTAVSELCFIPIDNAPFQIEGLTITPLPVFHGGTYISNGYRVGNVCYISDVSKIPDETRPLLIDCDLLVLDALRPDRPSASHFALPQALDEVRRIQPRRTLLTGMMHTMEHYSINEQLQALRDSEGIDVQLSYDGLRVPVDIPVDASIGSKQAVQV
eukprot:jgi/Chlat1/1505/Chrsp12S02078